MRFFGCLGALLFVLFTACGDDGGGLAPTPVADGGPTTTPPRPIDDPGTPDDPNTAPVPTISKLEPASGALGSVGPTVVVTGTGFLPRSVIRVDGTDLDTSFESDTQIAATLPTAKLAKVGELEIIVRTPKPGGGETAPLLFAVENPPPEIIALNPLSVPSATGDTKLGVVGSTFVSGSKIRFGLSELVTTFKDAEHLEGTIPAALLVTSASVPVSVTSPAPGGGTSSKIAFTISNSLAKITSLTPSAGIIGGSSFELTVKGTGFATGAAILFNGTKLPTTVVAAGELKATVGPELVNLFEIPVTVELPPPGGGVSEPATFKAENPIPTATSATPSPVFAGSNATAVTLAGTNFVATTKMTIDGAIATGATTVLSSTQIKATLTIAQIAKLGSVAIGAKTDAPGGGSSPTAVTVPITLTVPKVTTVEPSITLNASDPTITIKGTFFVDGKTTATANGQPIVVTYVKGDTITAVIPSSMTNKLGPIPIVVTNTGAAASAAAVNANVICDATGVNVYLKNTTDVQVFSTNFGTAPLLSRWTTGGDCPDVPFSAVVQKQPGRYSIVQNTTAVPVTLSAWADCTDDNKGAAYLAFYRRPTPPATDAERKVCEGFVSDGTPLASPSSGTSTNCPGLTKTNGGGMVVAACERVIVHVQPFDNTSTTFTPPKTVKIQAE